MTSTNSTIVNSIKRLNTIDNSTIVSSKEIDLALLDTQDLYQEQYKKWFAKQAIRLGATTYRRVASEARDGKHPQRLFVWMLKRV